MNNFVNREGKKTQKETKFRINISLPIIGIIAILALILGFLQGGFLGLLVTIGLGIFCYLASFTGIIPFIGPLFYALIGGFVKGLTSGIIPLAGEIIFWTFLAFSIFYCLVATVVTLVVWRKGKRRKKNGQDSQVP